jgi:limonene-1,2-epoxide hydrolase
MTEHTTPLAVARAFTAAWTRHDMAAAARYVAADVVFDGPFAHLTGAEAYLEGLAAFARHVTGMRLLAAFGDDDQALIMYELTTDPFGTIRGAERFAVRDGRIQTDLLTFDSHPIRQAREAATPAPSPA